MENADLPKEKAFEPEEQAHQPLQNNNMPPYTVQNISKKITFARTAGTIEEPSSQTSSSYKDVLSQPSNGLSHVQRLLWLQTRRTAGLWAQCDDCDRWRYLPKLVDRHELPQKWYCYMNPDSEFASCSVPEAPLRLRDEEDLIHSEYNAGSIVWARLAGWPWWPAMVDDCPDVEQFYWLDGFSDIPTHYNVVFFDNMEVTRAWIPPENLKPYSSNKNTFKRLLRTTKFNQRIKAAISQANDAEKMTLAKRLEKFSFISRHKGSIISPKKISKHDVIKHQRRLKNKFNIEFPIEVSDSEDESLNNQTTTKNKNVILLGTRKRPKKDKSQTAAVQKAANSDEENDLMCYNDKKQTPLFNNAQNSTDKTNSLAVQIGSTDATSIDNSY